MKPVNKDFPVMNYLRLVFSRLQPFYEQAVSDLDSPMQISLWVWVTHSSFIEGSRTTKNMAYGVFT